MSRFRVSAMLLSIVFPVSGLTGTSAAFADDRSCDALSCDCSGSDGRSCRQYSGRAFLFAWPGNNACDLRLD